MLYTLLFFFSKCSLFHNAKLFGSCTIHILYTGCAKIKKNNSGAKGLIMAGKNPVLIALHVIRTIDPRLKANWNNDLH